MNIKTYTPTEARAAFADYERADIAAVRWLMEQGVPEGFFGPYWCVDEERRHFFTRLTWDFDGIARVIATANTDEGACYGIGFNVLSANGKTSNSTWFSDREEWRRNLIAVMGHAQELCNE